jgi:hypothetical protein
VKGKAAIYVTPINEDRKNTGSYITEKARQLRTVKDDNTDFYKQSGASASPDTSGAAGTPPPSSEAPAPPDSVGADELPPGFVQ